MTKWTIKSLISVFVLSVLIYAFSAPKASAAASLPDGMVGQLYRQYVASTYWTISGLPPGLGLWRGFVYGIPTQGGIFTVMGNNSIPITLKIFAQPPYLDPAPGPCCGNYLISYAGGRYEFRFPWDAYQNSNFDYSIYWVTGGQAPLKWSVSAGSLPAGLNLGATSGKFSGKPTVAGRYKFSVTVADAMGQSSTVNYQLNVVPAAPAITLSQPVTWQLTQGDAFQKEIPCNCSSGVAYNWYVGTGSLPAGLSLNSATGVISGTPTTVDTYAAEVYLADNYGQNTYTRIKFTVNAKPLTITTSANLSAGSVQGADFNQTLQASGGKAPYRWYPASVAPESIFWRFKDYPNEIPGLGLKLNPTNGNIYGQIQGFGNLNFAIKVIDAMGVSVTKTMSIKSLPLPPTIAIVGVDSPVKGLPTLWTNSVAGFSTTSAGSFNLGYPRALGAEPMIWSVVKGTLPPGITIDSAGFESGKPTTPGNYYFTLQVTDAYGQSVTKDVTQGVLAPAPVQCVYEFCNPDMTQYIPPKASPAAPAAQVGLPVMINPTTAPAKPTPVLPAPAPATAPKTSTPVVNNIPTPYPTPAIVMGPTTSIPQGITDVAVTINNIMNNVVNIFTLTIAESTAVVGGVALAVGHGAVATIDGYYNLIFHPIQTGNNILNLDVNKVADDIIQTANAKMNAIIYINADDYVSVYNSGTALGGTLVSMHSILSKVDRLLIEKTVKGTEILNITIDVSAKANEQAEKDKISQAIKKAQEMVKLKKK